MRGYQAWVDGLVWGAVGGRQNGLVWNGGRACLGVVEVMNVVEPGWQSQQRGRHPANVRYHRILHGN